MMKAFVAFAIFILLMWGFGWWSIGYYFGG